MSNGVRRISIWAELLHQKMSPSFIKRVGIADNFWWIRGATTFTWAPSDFCKSPVSAPGDASRLLMTHFVKFGRAMHQTCTVLTFDRKECEKVLEKLYYILFKGSWKKLIFLSTICACIESERYSATHYNSFASSYNVDIYAQLFSGCYVKTWPPCMNIYINYR